LVTPYGIFALDQDPVINVLNLIFEAPKSNGVILMSDVEKVGRDDMLIMTATNLWYIDDGFTNSPGLIGTGTVNPCLDSTWKINTSVNVNVAVNDVDSDTVQARVFLYYNSVYEQLINWTTAAAAGTTFNFAFIANQTIGSGTIRVEGRDTENPGTVDTLDLTFSVASNGNVFGDCTTDFQGDSVTAAEEAESPARETDLNDNGINNAVNDMSDDSGLGSDIIWVLIMVGAAATIAITLFSEKNIAWQGILIIIGVFEIGLFYIGVKLKYFSIGDLISLLVLTGFILTIALRKPTTGD
jgi:hypothetical protein